MHIPYIDLSIEKEYVDFVVGHFPADADADANVSIRSGERFSVKKSGRSIEIVVTDKAQLFFAFTIIFANSEKETFEFTETVRHKKVTFMLDCSRSAVLNIKTCKDLIVLLAKLGFNALELYTEDTYEIPSEPYFGHLRGRYTKAELKDLDAFARGYGIELIPCMQTLTHLDNIFLWPEYWDIHDIWDCLLVEDEKSYALIDKMFAAVADCFSSRTIHIGFDEAYYSGRGKYFDKIGCIDKKKILRSHLEKVLSIAKKYGFNCKVYADMFLHNGDFKSCADLPDNVSFVYWNYYSTKKGDYIKDLEKMKACLSSVEFRAGDWKWLGNAPMNGYGIRRTKAGLAAAAEYGLNSLSLSAWGDNGNECSVFSTIPQIVNFAAFAYFGKCDKNLLNDLSLTLTGVSLDDFMKLDVANTYKLKNPVLPVNPAKYLLLNDPLCGIMDYHVDPSYNAYYKKCTRVLKNAAKRSGEWKYLFDEQVALCDYLSVKANMGNDLYALYSKKDIAGLEKYAATTVAKAIKKLDAFIAVYRYAWYKENKTFGFDVSELRLGGQKQRLLEIRQRIKELAEGKIDRIEELEQPKLPFDKNTEKGLLYIHNSKYIISPFFPVV